MLPRVLLHNGCSLTGSTGSRGVSRTGGGEGRKRDDRVAREPEGSDWIGGGRVGTRAGGSRVVQ